MFALIEAVFPLASREVSLGKGHLALRLRCDPHSGGSMLMSTRTPCFQSLQSIPVLIHVLLSSWTGSMPKSLNLFSDSGLLFQPVPLILSSPSR